MTNHRALARAMAILVRICLIDAVRLTHAIAEWMTSKSISKTFKVASSRFDTSTTPSHYEAWNNSSKVG